MIELRPSDLYIKEVERKDGTKAKCVSLKNGLAFDTEFVGEMIEQGVKEFIQHEESVGSGY